MFFILSDIAKFAHIFTLNCQYEFPMVFIYKIRPTYLTVWSSYLQLFFWAHDRTAWQVSSLPADGSPYIYGVKVVKRSVSSYFTASI